MAVQRPNRLIEIARDQYGETPDTLVPRMLREAGSIAGAARIMGVNPNAVRYWMKKLNIRTESQRVLIVVEVKS